jgi:HlyD family secretion protein
MNPDRIQELQIDQGARRRSTTGVWLIFLGVLAITGVAIYFAWPRAEDQRRPAVGTVPAVEARSDGSVARGDSTATASAVSSVSAADRGGNAVLTVTGYIINRERIELSPRFLGVVKWIGVKKGDAVTNGQVVVLLDDAEYQARLREVDGRLGVARVAVEKAQLDFERASQLAKEKVESKQIEDDARLALDSARAAVTEIEGGRALIRTYIDWCVIRSPIDGVVLEKLVDPNELVVPQSFGGTRGPSTALIALADPKDLQVEIDLNERDLAKVRLGQPCRVSPEAYPDKAYEGHVAEIAPEANRQKGTLQIKVQIRNPDRYLTPELTARVDFLKAPAGHDSN